MQTHFTDSQLLYSAIKRLEVGRDLLHFSSLQRQGRFQREALPHADMSCSVGHLTNTKINDHLTRFIAKGRLQLLETNTVNSTYYPGEYSQACSLCAFQWDSNSHALNCCRRLKGLYIERHDRCVELVRRELERYIVTEHVAVFQNQPVSLDGVTPVDSGRPDLCFVDHSNSVAFIVEVANPYDTFIDHCYNSKFRKYMPLCLLMNDAGFNTKVVVLIIGSLGTVHRRVVPGLRMLGLPQRQSRSLARYLSVSVMIGSRRAWARRNYMCGKQ